jgi:hypothetical protein
VTSSQKNPPYGHELEDSPFSLSSTFLFESSFVSDSELELCSWAWLFQTLTPCSFISKYILYYTACLESKTSFDGLHQLHLQLNFTDAFTHHAAPGPHITSCRPKIYERTSNSSRRSVSEAREDQAFAPTATSTGTDTVGRVEVEVHQYVRVACSSLCSFTSFVSYRPEKDNFSVPRPCYASPQENRLIH